LNFAPPQPNKKRRVTGAWKKRSAPVPKSTVGGKESGKGFWEGRSKGVFRKRVPWKTGNNWEGVQVRKKQKHERYPKKDQSRNATFWGCAPMSRGQWSNLVEKKKENRTGERLKKRRRWKKPTHFSQKSQQERRQQAHKWSTGKEIRKKTNTGDKWASNWGVLRSEGNFTKRAKKGHKNNKKKRE